MNTSESLEESKGRKKPINQSVKVVMHLLNPSLRSAVRCGTSSRSWLALIAAITVSSTAVQAQKVYFESFDSIILGPSLEEGLAGQTVWSKAGPTGWVSDDTGVPGVGTDLDGITEWAGWSFADKNWWVNTAGNQRRAEWAYAQGTVLISDPDEWDDAAHAPGLLNSFITSSPISIPASEENSLVLTLDSSWRPEAFDDGLPDFPVDENNRPINHQNGVLFMRNAEGVETELLNFDSDNTSPNFHRDGVFINEAVVIPLNNAAGATTVSLKFGMLSAANDWWWAVDNVAIGVPPFVSGITNDGVRFAARITEALDRTVDESSISAQLDDQSNIAITVERDETRVWVTHSQEPTVFAPKSKHLVTLRYNTGTGKSVTDSISFTAPGYTSVSSTPTTLRASVAEASWLTLDESKGIQLELDGKAVVTKAVTRVGSVVHADYEQSETFVSGSAHTLKATFTSITGQVLQETVAFKAPLLATLPEAIATDLGTGSDSGMRWRTHQLATGRGNSVSLVEAQLRGELGESVHTTELQAEDGYFPIDFVNFDQNAGAAGNFKTGADAPQDVADLLIPGIPGTTGSKDDIAGEALTFLELSTVGVYTMVVNSDDGFQVSVGPSSNPTSLVLGKFDGGRGAADSLFYFKVLKPGVYPFRLLWFEGDSDARVEWFTVNADGSRALVGGSQDGSLPAFRQRTEVPVNGIQSITRQADGKIAIAYTGVLKSSTSVTGPFDAVQGATSPIQVIPADSQRFYRVE